MIPLEQLDLPPASIEKIKAAGVNSVEQLCAMRLLEVGAMFPDHRINGIKEVRVALGKLELDLLHFTDDPVGTPVTQSRKILNELFDLLDLAPETRKQLKAFLLVRGFGFDNDRLLSLCDPDDRGKIMRLFELIEYCRAL
jgi:hypothetical protein